MKQKKKPNYNQKGVSYYSLKPYEPGFIDRLYSSNGEFRKYMKATLRFLAKLDPQFAQQIEGREKDADPARELALDLVHISNQAGEIIQRDKTKYFPHPALVASWIQSYLADSNDGKNILDKSATGETLILAQLLQAFKFPSRLANYWDNLVSKLHKEAKDTPHWFVRNVEPCKAPKDGAYRGFKLKSMKVRIPFGTTNLARARSKNSYTVPERIEEREIDFSALSHQVGEAWIGVSADNKSVFLASERMPRMDLAELLSTYSKPVGRQNMFGDTIQEAGIAGLSPLSELGERVIRREKRLPAAYQAELRKVDPRKQAQIIEQIGNTDKAITAVRDLPPDMPFGGGSGGDAPPPLPPTTPPKSLPIPNSSRLLGSIGVSSSSSSTSNQLFDQLSEEAKSNKFTVSAPPDTTSSTSSKSRKQPPRTKVYRAMNQPKYRKIKNKDERISAIAKDLGATEAYVRQLMNE